MRISSLAKAAAAICIAAGGLTVGAGSAQAAQSCYGSTCNHLNPYKTTCTGDAIHPYSAPDSNGSVVYLYYSPSCRATWAETWNAPSGTWITVQRRNGDVFSEDWATSAAHTWTGMINDAGYASFAEICPPSGGHCGVTASY
ncbi:uncharacterized protein DUF2690 [Streptomyces sp. Ag109_O5-1]|uniref:DUF2690 domain-containing protein n=1 Tax=Streptomyces sp. Ag109_O5-1 TaxID=1938851 RepID=UPI000F50ADFA|nr:DUF2690 domain-containing protein [Streptomyces sp. Ag109_O5-1]RPE38930.1 uncharacterized protein DUF2690 [Streptomyces sp. Ag109_O5-1]